MGAAGPRNSPVGLTGGRERWVLVGLWAVVMVALFRPEPHGFDTVAYYAWVRSLVIQGNLDATDTFARYGYPAERGVSPTGQRLNEWPVGTALLWLPFFLTAHFVVLALRGAGVPLAADGYSPPYLILTALGSAAYGLAGLLILLRLASAFAHRSAAFWAAVSLWLATPLVFYMSAHPFMSHAADFFINALFLLAWAGNKSGRRSRLRLGLVGGLAACVRYQNATLLLWPALADLAGIRAEPRRTLCYLVSFAAGALVGFLPQMAAWRVVFGDWLVLNPYGIVGAGYFDLRSPHLVDVLLSTDRGLLTWTPVSAPALAGLLVWLVRWQPAWGWLAAAQFAAQVYLVGAWSSWSGGAAFGPRLLVGLLPGLGLGLAAFYQVCFRRWGDKPMAIVSGAVVAWNLILLARYGLNDLPHAGPVPLDDLWVGQFRFLLSIGRHLEALQQGLLRLGP